MAEPTDPAELTVLKAYDDAYGKLTELQDNLPDADSEGTMDAWVLNMHSLWKIVGANWQKAGVSSRAWCGVETELVELIPKIHEDSITVAFTEYNKLVACAKTPANQARSQVSSSPIQQHQESVAPPANLSRQTTLTLQTPKQLLPPATPPCQASSAPVMPKAKTSVLPPHEPVPSQTRRPSLSMTKANTGASSLFPPKPSAGPSFLGLRETNSSKTGPSAAIQSSGSHLQTVNVKARTTIIQRSQSGPLDQDDEDEQSHGVMVNEEHVEESGGEDGISQGQGDDAPTPPMGGSVDEGKGPNSDDTSSPPPTQSHRKKIQMLFIFDDATGDFADPYRSTFLPRPRARTPQDQAPHRSTHPCASPTDPDTTYLQVAQGSKPLNVKKDRKHCVESSSKKDVKGQEKEVVAHKRTRDEDNAAAAVDKPASKKLKSTDTKGNIVEGVLFFCFF
ncbi:uncharacterized protein ARMOST_09946 [Armillaria ostoyae]|uniref:Uncharacterized protein n=1 Tax=Armillaria ostoyae TaxID=47428 RepID=A0A284RCY6_ARMOS|nr:uncharacterized protein ARMOST_09946 [Armillaria ostoyae]